MTTGIKKMYFRNLSLINNNNNNNDKPKITLDNIIEHTDDIYYNNLLTKVKVVEESENKNLKTKKKIKINEIKNVNNKLYFLE